MVGCKTWNVERTGTLEWTMEWIMEWTRQAKFTIVKRPQKTLRLEKADTRHWYYMHSLSGKVKYKFIHWPRYTLAVKLSDVTEAT